jgi:aspartate/methionine/tyrosine aminotransferase
VLVSPNNPTGKFLDPTQLEDVASRCAAQGGPLVLDASFRLFEPEALFDCAQILDRSGCEFVVIEDTGKIWPTTDLKLAYLVASSGLAPGIQEVADDILLNVSPFVSLLIESLAGRAEYVEEVRQLIERNREVLRSHFQALVAEGLVRFPHLCSRASVEVVQCRRSSDSAQLVDDLDVAGVAALSTDGFWWAGNRVDASDWDEVRVALSRDEAPFDEAVVRMVHAIAERPKGD